MTTELKQASVFVFDDGILSIKTADHAAQNGWGVLAFHERQVEIDADGYYHVEIAPSELKALRDFITSIFPAERVRQHDNARSDLLNEIALLKHELAQANEDKIAIRAFRDAAVETGDAFAEKLVIAEDALAALRAKTLAVIETERDAIETYLKNKHNSYKNRDKRFEYGEVTAQNDGMENRYWAALQFIRDYRRSLAARALEDELKGGTNVVSR